MPNMYKIGTTATKIYTENGTTRVRYHSTDVVEFNAASITLRHGGWRTATTKNRMNQAARVFGLDFDVYQKDFDWFVRHGDRVIPFDSREVILARA